MRPGGGQTGGRSEERRAPHAGCHSGGLRPQELLLDFGLLLMGHYLHPHLCRQLQPDLHYGSSHGRENKHGMFRASFLGMQ